MTERLLQARELSLNAHLMVDATSWVRPVRSSGWIQVVEDMMICGLRKTLDSCLTGCRQQNIRSSLENLGCSKVLEESQNSRLREVVVWVAIYFVGYRRRSMTRVLLAVAHMILQMSFYDNLNLETSQVLRKRQCHGIMRE